MSAHAWERCADAGLLGMERQRGHVPPRRRDMLLASYELRYPTAYPTAPVLAHHTHKHAHCFPNFVNSTEQSEAPTGSRNITHGLCDRSLLAVALLCFRRTPAHAPCRTTDIFCTRPATGCPPPGAAIPIPDHVGDRRRYTIGLFQCSPQQVARPPPSLPSSPPCDPLPTICARGSPARAARSSCAGCPRARR
eukprot:4044114-Prymnesium_polylepis.1